ncbi:MAG: phage head completion protein [bacterium]
MQLPHRLVVVNPVEIVDEYNNPVPGLHYGSGASLRTVYAHVQPIASSESADPGRTPVVTRWRVFATEPIGPQERVEWRGMVFEVDGEPLEWTPRFGHTHFEITLRRIEG